jgi:hypothetical protein
MPPAAIIGIGAAATAGIAGNAQKKAQQSAQNFAQDQAAAAREEQRRLEEKFGLTPGELERQDRVFELEEKRQKELETRAGKTGQQLIEEEGTIPKALLQEVEGRLGQTGEELFRGEGEVNEQLADSITNFDEDLRNKELSLVLDQIQAEQNRRGIAPGEGAGDIGFEGLGRAGVDFAVKSASERLNQQQALSQAFINLAQNARAEAGTVSERALGVGTKARDDLAKFLNDIQNFDQQSKGRAQNAALGAAGIAQNQIGNSFGVVTDVFGNQAGEAGAIKSQGLGALGDIGGSFLDDFFDKRTVEEPKQIEDFQGEFGVEDILERLGGRTGGADRPGFLGGSVR